MPQTLSLHEALATSTCPSMDADKMLPPSWVVEDTPTTTTIATTEKRKRQESFVKQKLGPFYPPLPVTIRMLTDPDAVQRAGSGRVSFPAMGCNGAAQQRRFTKVVICGRVMAVTHAAAAVTHASHMDCDDSDDDDVDDGCASYGDEGDGDYSVHDAVWDPLQGPHGRRAQAGGTRQPAKRRANSGRRRRDGKGSGLPHAQVCVCDGTGWVMVRVFHPPSTVSPYGPVDQHRAPPGPRASPWLLAVSVGDYVVCTGSIKTRPPMEPPCAAVGAVGASVHQWECLPTPYYTASCVSHIEVRSADACPLSGREELLALSAETSSAHLRDGRLFRTASCRVVDDSNELLLHMLVVVETVLRQRQQAEADATVRAETRVQQERCTFTDVLQGNVVSADCEHRSALGGDALGDARPDGGDARTAPCAVAPRKALPLPPWLLPSGGEHAGGTLIVAGRHASTGHKVLGDINYHQEAHMGAEARTHADVDSIQAPTALCPTVAGLPARTVAPSTTAMLRCLPRSMLPPNPSFEEESRGRSPPLEPTNQITVPPAATHRMRNVLRSRSAPLCIGGQGGIPLSHHRVVGAPAMGLGAGVPLPPIAGHVPCHSAGPCTHDGQYDGTDVGGMGFVRDGDDGDDEASAWAAPSPFDDDVREVAMPLPTCRLGSLHVGAPPAPSYPLLPSTITPSIIPPAFRNAGCHVGRGDQAALRRPLQHGSAHAMPHRMPMGPQWDHEPAPQPPPTRWSADQHRVAPLFSIPPPWVQATGPRAPLMLPVSLQQHEAPWGEHTPVTWCPPRYEVHQPHGAMRDAGGPSTWWRVDQQR